MRRYSVDAADLRHLKLARFKELRFVVRHGDPLEFHVFLKDCHFAGIGRTAVSSVPALTQFLRVFHRIGMRENTGGRCTVGEELTSIFLCGNTQADGVLLQRNGTVAHDAIEAQTWNVQQMV